jgi:hypothetical protein
MRKSKKVLVFLEKNLPRWEQKITGDPENVNQKI